MGVRVENNLGSYKQKIIKLKKMSGSRVPVTMRDFFFDDPFFKNTWEDFDKVRDAMFNESRDMWKKFDDDFRNMACMSKSIMLESPARAAGEQEEEQGAAPRSLMRQDSKSRWENGWMFPRRWMLRAGGGGQARGEGG